MIEVRTTTLLVLLTALVTPALDAREVFKWVDENGVVHFSEQAPPDDVSGSRRIVLEEAAATDRDTDDDPFNIEATAARMQTYRDDMARRREEQRKERLERERIAAQRPVIQYQHGGRYAWPWYSRPPLQPVPPIQPQPPTPEPYPTYPFRPPGG